MAIPLDLLWEPIVRGRFDGDDLAQFLRAAHNSLPPGSFAAEVGRLFVAEDVEGRELPIRLDEFTTLRTTRRIDGILPLDIPSPNDLAVLVAELLESAVILGLDFPESDRLGRIRRELGLALLSFLHRRHIRALGGLRIELFLECPHSALSGRRPEIGLSGELPLGGRIIVLTTALKATDWLEGISDAGLGHCGRLEAVRTSEGALKLRSA